MNSPERQGQAGELPLSGIRVLELGHTVMGPSCSMVLADLGADVIKVEPPEGDRTRANVGFGSALFPVFNRNKRSISIDIKTEAGKAVIHKVIAGADALVENFAHGTMDRLGLGYEALAAAYPRLVYCSLKGFLSGPYEKRAALDEIVQFMGGLAYMTGPRGMPLRAGASVVDIMGGMFGALGILAALRERERTGRGQLVQSALFESTAFLVAQHMGQQALTGVAPPPMPEKASSWAVYDPFQTADGRTVFAGITSDNHWRSFCTGFGVEELLSDPALKTNPLRARAREKIMPIVTEKFAAETFASLVAKLERLNIPFGPLARPGDLFDDPHLNHGGRMLDVLLPTGKRAKLPGIPLDMGGRQTRIRRQPPGMGEHTRQVLEEAGYAAEQIDKLVEQGIAIVQ
ncbi:MAG: formyl-CoA transferase [Betaproteobacteria bacterium RIFCSPLOWO2_12_FULL_62_58]|nr:MAG: formyl-CoA transferase [Betaproteobacteria bacterium RIFCSPLOWO2_12_FULL_62_58]